MNSNDHHKQAADRFDNWADTYGTDRISRWFEYFQCQALSRLPLEDGCVFLDIGCGPGFAVREAAKRFALKSAVGVDVSPKMIAKAKSLTTDMPEVDYRIASAHSIPYPDDTFHGVICTFSFHHYQQPETVLREIWRVLKPEGSFVLVDSARNISVAIWLQDRFRRHFEKSHVKYYTVREMGELLRATNWKLVHDVQTEKGFMRLGKAFTGAMIFECSKK